VTEGYNMEERMPPKTVENKFTRRIQEAAIVPIQFHFINPRETDAPMLPVPTLSAAPSCTWAVAELSKTHCH
jgi:hypothetical protein